MTVNVNIMKPKQIIKMLSRNYLLCTKLTSFFLPTRGSVVFKFICAELLLIAKQFSENYPSVPSEQDNRQNDTRTNYSYVFMQWKIDKFIECFF